MSSWKEMKDESYFKLQCTGLIGAAGGAQPIVQSKYQDERSNKAWFQEEVLLEYCSRQIQSEMRS